MPIGVVDGDYLSIIGIQCRCGGIGRNEFRLVHIHLVRERIREVNVVSLDQCLVVVEVRVIQYEEIERLLREYCASSGLSIVIRKVAV
jgi:hypothetical protein